MNDDEAKGQAAWRWLMAERERGRPSRSQEIDGALNTIQWFRTLYNALIQIGRIAGILTAVAGAYFLFKGSL